MLSMKAVGPKSRRYINCSYKTKYLQEPKYLILSFDNVMYPSGYYRPTYFF